MRLLKHVVPLLFPVAVLAQQPSEVEPLAVGSAAPPLQVAEWLDGADPFADAGTGFGGRAALLVFWAPWCGSCIAEFPHLNHLVEACEGLPITIVSITNEPMDKVEALLARQPLHTRRALDDAGKTFAVYGVRVLPRVVLVGADGRIAAMPKLADVDADVLRALASGGDVDLPAASQQQADLQWGRGGEAFDAERSLAHVVIEASQAASGAMRMPPGSGRITADGVGFANLVQVACGAQPHEVRATHPAYRDFDRRYRVSVKAPDGQADTAREMLREQLQRLVPFRAEWTEVEEKTPVLRRIAGAELGALRQSTAGKAAGTARAGVVDFEKQSMPTLARTIGTFAFGKAMVDETGLEGDWDLLLEWTPGDKESLVKALAACGLEFVTEMRKVRKLEVREP